MSGVPIPVPSGTVTFLFTDIEGSTKRWEQYPQQMRHAVERHDALLRHSIEAHGGYVFKTVGDAFCAAFSTPHDTLAAALAAQRALQAEDWNSKFKIQNPEFALRVRMALHTGVTQERDGDYFGQPLNRVARLLSAGHGEQVLLSQPTHDLICDDLPPGITLLDLGEHRLKDLQRSEHIFQLVAPDLHPDGTRRFPPLKTLDTQPNNLPPQPTAFIGREKELAAIYSLLCRPEVRLVTLTGPGGTGKTRLALQVAAEALDNFQHGVFFVGLAPVSDPNLVVSTIAQTLRVREVGGGQPLVQTLMEYLGDKQMLLALDNFEHLKQAAPVVDALLKASPRLKVLTTSRVNLHLYGEKEFFVPPFPLPDTHDLPPMESFTQNEAVRLFMERAQDVRPDFEVTAENAQAVGEICARLDGLPLAIELAAARVRLFAPSALLARLVGAYGRMPLLTGGAGNLPARHQTLRGAIEWSYDLLDAGEQQLFKSLAVFQGGCSFEAIEAVCNAQGDLQADVLEGVDSLLSKSLLRERAGSDESEEPRLWMLETIRDYAWEKLQASGEGDELRRRHAQYFLTLAEQDTPHLERVRQTKPSKRVEDDYYNMRAALDWAEVNDVGVGLRLAAALSAFWRERGHHTEARERISTLLSHPDAAAHAEARGRVLLGMCALAFEQGDQAMLRSLAEESLAAWREIGDKHGTALSLSWLAASVYALGDTNHALSLYEEALALYREVDNRDRIADTLTNAAFMINEQGDADQARSMLEEALIICRELGDSWGMGLVLENLGEVAYALGEYDTARTCWEESLAIFRQRGHEHRIAFSFHHLGCVEHRQGNYDSACAFFTESLELCKERGFKSLTASCLVGLAGVMGSKGQAQQAARLFGVSEALREHLGSHLEGPDRVDYARAIAATRSQLDEATWEAAWAEGRAMSVEQALDYALRVGATLVVALLGLLPCLGN